MQGAEGREGRGEGGLGMRGRTSTFRILPIPVMNILRSQRDQPTIHPVAFNLIAAMDMIVRNSFVLDDDRATNALMEQNLASRREKARCMHELMLPDGNGVLLTSLWPRTDAMCNAHELGVPVGAMTQKKYEEFFETTADNHPWDEVEADVKLVQERFGKWVDLIMYYGAKMAAGDALEDLVELPESCDEYRLYIPPDCEEGEDDDGEEDEEEEEVQSLEEEEEEWKEEDE